MANGVHQFPVSFKRPGLQSFPRALKNTTMSVHAVRLARLFTPEYARRINAQIVYPAESVVVKPNELESALGRPLHVSYYEPDRPAAYLAATLSYGIIKGTFLLSPLRLFVFTNT